MQDVQVGNIFAISHPFCDKIVTYNDNDDFEKSYLKLKNAILEDELNQIKLENEVLFLFILFFVFCLLIVFFY